MVPSFRKKCRECKCVAGLGTPQALIIQQSLGTSEACVRSRRWESSGLCPRQMPPKG